MADNNIGKPLTMVEKVTDPNANTNVIINDNGNVHQVAVNDLLKNSDVNTSLDEVKKSTVANIVNPTLQTITQNGVTCTNNGDGTYTINGTSTIEENDFYFIHDNNLLTFGTKYKYLCLSSTYSYIVNDTYYNETGNGIIFTAYNTLFKAFFRCGKGITYNNLILKPMLTTNLSATYDDFVPYTGDTGALNTDVADIKNTLDNFYNDSYQYIPVIFGEAYNGNVISSMIYLPNAINKEITISAVQFNGGAKPGGDISVTKHKLGFYIVHSNTPAFENKMALVSFTVS